MSLVNDALRRARVEALRQEAIRDGVDYRAVPAHSRRGARSVLQIAGWVVAALALAVVAWLVLRSPASELRALESPASTASQPSGPAAIGPSEAPLDSEVPGTEASAEPSPAIEVDRSPTTGSPALTPELESPAEAPPTESPAGDRSLPSSPVPPRASATQQVPAARLKDGATYLRRATSADGSTIELGGIAYSEDRPIAVINGSVISPGDMIAGYTIVAIEPERVELEADGVRIYLSLH